MGTLRLFPVRVYLAWRSVRDCEEGQAMVEYALILFLVSIVSVGILSALGNTVSSVFSKVNADL